MTTNWTAARIYKPGHTWKPAVVDAGTVIETPYVFTPEFLEAFRSETSWLPENMSARNTDLTRTRLGVDACPICSGVATPGSIRVRHTGATTGIICSALIPCPCAAARAIASAQAVLPVTVRSASLASARPHGGLSLSPEGQALVIERLRAQTGNVLLFGPPSTGKTHLAAGIFLDAVRSWAKSPARGTCPAIYIDATRMLDEWMAYNKSAEGEEGHVVVPIVTTAKVRSAEAAGFVPLLVLDDIDLLKLTASRLPKLLAILKDYRDAGGRVVMTSKRSPAELADKWAAVAGSDSLVDWMQQAGRIRFVA